VGNENGQMKLAFIKLFHFPKDSLAKLFSSRAASYLDYLVYHKTPFSRHSINKLHSIAWKFCWNRSSQILQSLQPAKKNI